MTFDDSHGSRNRMYAKKRWKQQVKEGKVKQLSVKEVGYARRENKNLRRPTRRKNNNLQCLTKRENKNLRMGREKGPCYFELNESFQNPNIVSFPDITLTSCTWFILPYKVA